MTVAMFDCLSARDLRSLAMREEIRKALVQRDTLAEALRQLLLDLREHAHGNPVPGHTKHISEAWAALATAGVQP